MLLGADEYRQRRKGPGQRQPVFQVSAAVLHADHLPGVALRQRGDTGVAEWHAAQTGYVVQQQLELRVVDATHHLRHRLDYAGVARLAEIKGRHVKLAVAAQLRCMASDRDRIGQGACAGDDDRLLGPNAAGEQGLKQGFALGHAECRPFAGGAE